MPTLFDPVRVGDLELPNRIIMAPLTRNRAKPGTDLEKMKESGYLTEALVIKLATDAGFKLDAKSEVNANPKDTADWEKGVWTLPPIRQSQGRGDQAGRVLTPEERAAFDAIGESDRMTLRLRKPE